MKENGYARLCRSIVDEKPNPIHIVDITIYNTLVKKQ